MPREAKNKPPKRRPPIVLSEAHRGVWLRWRHNSWHVCWRDPVTRRERSRKAGLDPNDIRLAADEALRQLNGGRPLRNSKTLVWDVIEDWFRSELIPNKTPRTTDNYRWICERYLNGISEAPVSTISSVKLEGILGAMARDGKSSSVQLKTKCVMGSLFRWATSVGYILVNPAANLPIIREVPERDIEGMVMTMSEMLTLADCADASDGYYRTHTRTLALTGMRFGELAAVKKNNCHFDEPGIPAHIHITQSYCTKSRKLKSTKNGKERYVYCPAELADDIKQLMDKQKSMGIEHPDGFVFTSSLGNMLSDTNYRTRVFQPAYQKAVDMGLMTAKRARPCPHVLRHGVATALQENNVPRYVASQHLGHSSSITTARYSHTTDHGRRQALEVLEGFLLDYQRPKTGY